MEIINQKNRSSQHIEISKVFLWKYSTKLWTVLVQDQTECLMKYDLHLHQCSTVRACVKQPVSPVIQWIPLNRNPDNRDFRLFATFCLAPILFPFRQCKIHWINGTLIKDIFGLLQEKSSHRLEFFFIY